MRSCNYTTYLRVTETTNEETIMQTLGKIAATLSVIGAIAVGSAAPAAAWYGHHRHYGYYHHHRHLYAYHPYYHHYHHRHYWY